MKHDSTPVGLLWISPWLLGFAIFTILPVSMGIWYGFTDYTLLESPIPVGLDNYERMAGDEVLGIAIWNTAIFAVASIVIGTILSISLAVLLANPMRFQFFWRAAVFAVHFGTDGLQLLRRPRVPREGRLEAVEQGLRRQAQDG